MEANPNILEILDTAMKNISKRVAKLDMFNSATVEIDKDKSCSFVITTKGDYCLTIVLYAGNDVLRAITENMKRGETADESDIAVYTTEYFNILCGHVISAMNNSIHASARFGVPQMVKGRYMEDDSPNSMENKQELFYKCAYGPLKVETLYKQCS